MDSNVHTGSNPVFGTKTKVMKERVLQIHTGEGGVKNYLRAFFKECNAENIEAKVEEAYNYIVEHPNEANIFGITVTGEVKTKMKFTDVYEFPFHRSDTMVLDNKNQFIFMFETGFYFAVPQSKLDDMISIINNLPDRPKLLRKDAFEYNNDGVVKFKLRSSLGSVPAIIIRGWGNLTGRLNLSSEEAISIQNDLAHYIVKQLNENGK